MNKKTIRAMNTYIDAVDTIECYIDLMYYCAMDECGDDKANQKAYLFAAKVLDEVRDKIREQNGVLQGNVKKKVKKSRKV